MKNNNLEPWVKSYPENINWAAHINKCSLGTYIEKSAINYGNRPAIDFLGSKTSYAELEMLVNHAARGLQELGVHKGVRVGLCLPNTPYFVIFYFAVLRIGATVVNFNPLYVESEIAFQIDDSQTEIMVTMDLEIIYPKIATMLTRTKSLKTIICCPMAHILPPIKGLLFRALKRRDIATIKEEQTVPYKQVMDNDGRPTKVEIDLDNDIAVLQYTGGTTGTPKGAMLSHGNLSANVSQMTLWFPGLELGAEKVLGVLPLFHIFAMTTVMNFAVSAGAEMILLPRYELKQTLKTINKKSPTLFPAVPTIYTSINNSDDLSKYNLSAIRYCISGGAPLPLEVKNRFEELTGCRLVEGYGLSECSPVATCNSLQGINKEGSIGLPVPGTLLSVHDIEDPNLTVSPNERGEIWISGPQVMSGYWQRDSETEDTLIDGWLRTGDAGYMDDEGHFFLVDRLKDLILCSGYNVYPRNIEEAIYLHPAVSEVTVIGISDEYRGESPKAFVKLKENEELSEEILLEFLKDKLSKIEMPSIIEFRSELPKTLIGKLSKKELKAEEAGNHNI
ncbi:MAG: dicarboxylate--CoA ligase PimA [Acidiferrobacteraceae bacterium]|nr:dicarboxylate--CoA ligase PimA [Acidiferrobacteraceae bacterium]